MSTDFRDEAFWNFKFYLNYLHFEQLKYDVSCLKKTTETTEHSQISTKIEERKESCEKKNVDVIF
jgi:hypothetical protein